MKQKIVVGGFASDIHQIQTVCEKLSEHYDEDVVGMNFREARQYPRRLAALIDGREVITHSAGFVALQSALVESQAQPESITAIAPPVPERIRSLVWRGFMMGARLRSLEDEDIGTTVRDELIRHARGNFGALPMISHFSAFEAASLDAARGISTTIAMMTQDRLFPARLYAVDKLMERVRQFNARLIGIRGDHVRFTHEPVQVLSEIAIAQAAGQLQVA